MAVHENSFGFDEAITISLYGNKKEIAKLDLALDMLENNVIDNHTFAIAMERILCDIKKRERKGTECSRKP